MTTALITGVTGQDGHYLAQSLVGKGYDVYGLVRRTSTPPKVPHGVRVLEGDVTDLESVRAAVEASQPHEVYNLAAQSHVGTSFSCPEATHAVNGIGADNVFVAVMDHAPAAAVYQAGTSEMFGGVSDEPCTETTPFHPRSPYGCSKVYAHHLAVHYREAYGLRVSNGILFNHESPYRGEQFVTRKITKAVGQIVVGRQQALVLGNLLAVRDWGYAGDYMRAMWMMLQRPFPDDFVVATGVSRSVLDFVKAAFQAGALDHTRYVKTDINQFRPTDVDVLRANPAKANDILGWHPTMSFEELVQNMVLADIARTVKGTFDGP